MGRDDQWRDEAGVGPTSLDCGTEGYCYTLVLGGMQTRGWGCECAIEEAVSRPLTAWSVLKIKKKSRSELARRCVCGACFGACVPSVENC